MKINVCLALPHIIIILIAIHVNVLVDNMKLIKVVKHAYYLVLHVNYLVLIVYHVLIVIKL